MATQLPEGIRLNLGTKLNLNYPTQEGTPKTAIYWKILEEIITGNVHHNQYDCEFSLSGIEVRSRKDVSSEKVKSFWEDSRLHNNLYYSESFLLFLSTSTHELQTMVLKALDSGRRLNLQPHEITTIYSDDYFDVNWNIEVPSNPIAEELEKFLLCNENVFMISK